jgi:hypothetical protein
MEETRGASPFRQASAARGLTFCYTVQIQERAVLSNAHSETELASVTREWAAFDSRTIAPHD